MAIAERTESYLWSNIELQDATLLVWEHDDHGLASAIDRHTASIQSNTRLINFTGNLRRGAQTQPAENGAHPVRPLPTAVADLSLLKHGTIDCAVLAFNADSLTFTTLLTILHKVHLLLKDGGRLVVRMDSLSTGQTPDLRWWDRRNRLAKAVASLAGAGQRVELTSDELVAILQVIGFSSIRPMLFHGEALSPIAITTLVEEITQYNARLETANWRQAITDELKLLRQQLETENGYTAPVAIIDATKQAKQ